VNYYHFIIWMDIFLSLLVFNVTNSGAFLLIFHSLALGLSLKLVCINSCLIWLTSFCYTVVCLWDFFNNGAACSYSPISTLWHKIFFNNGVLYSPISTPWHKIFLTMEMSCLYYPISTPCHKILLTMEMSCSYSPISTPWHTVTEQYTSTSEHNLRPIL
jgi:hypothetical protein